MSKDKLEEETQHTNPETADQDNGEQAEAKKEPGAEERLAEVNDKYLRLYAEFDNFRKRTQRERAEYIKSAAEDVFKELLPVVDDFERSIKASESVQDVKTISEGVQLIYNKLQHVLKQKGIEVMESKGRDFDPDTMEAVTNIPAPEPGLKGKVVDEIEKGYLLNGKVIRYAKVVVGS